jgi:hypothetical protein
MADATLAGVFAGGVVSFATTLCFTAYLDSRRRCHEANSAASMFRGCMISLTELIARRQFIERLRRHANNIRSTEQTLRFEIHAQRNYLRFLDQNVERIDMLQAPLPDSLCTFYVLTCSAVEACTATLEDELWLRSPHDAATFLEDLAGLLEEICRLKNDAVEYIDSIYPKRNPLARLVGAIS